MTDYAIASPNGGTWSIQSTNTATVGRYHDLGFLAEGASGAGNCFKQSRPGILAGPPIAAASNIPGAFAVAPTTGLGWNVQPGAAVVERTTLVGSYQVESTAVGTGAVTTADPSQTRVDRLDLQVLDGGLGDNAGTSVTSVKVTKGTAGSGLPAAPINSDPLGYWTIPAGTLTLTTAMWTDTRKSASVRGATRVLLPGDLLSDPGFMVGERRIRYHATYGWLEDVWDAAGAVWRGIKVLELAAPAISLGILTAATPATLASLAIVDPGFPYHLETCVGADWEQSSGAGAGVAGMNLSVQMDTTTWSTNIVAFGYDSNFSTNNSNVMYCQTPTNSSKAAYPTGLVGAHTVYLMANITSANGLIPNSVANMWHLKLVPA